MAIEWGPATKAAAERQAKAIWEAASEPRHFRLAERAEAGEFTDYSDTHACPITELHRLCRQYGLHSTAERIANGEFDATLEESNEWARSPSGQSVAKELSPELRAFLELPLKN